MKKTTGHIIILAFPDTFVKLSDEWISRVLPWFGLGGKGYIKAGHAAMVLVDSESGALHYFDFGRYVTPKGMGRVRSASTDAELRMPMKALFSENGTIVNLNDILLWLEAHPERTHGVGRMIASVCGGVDFEKAFNHATTVQNKGTIPYGAFCKGSNCARFVTDTILKASHDRKVRNQLKRIKMFTPSAIGNVVFGSTDQDIREVYEGNISKFGGSAIRENLVNYFHQISTENGKAKSTLVVEEGFYKLEGIGSNAYFQLDNKNMPRYHFRIKHFNDAFQQTFDGVYYSADLDLNLPFEFTYDSHCAFCHVQQEGKRIKLELVEAFEPFNSWHRERSA